MISTQDSAATAYNFGYQAGTDKADKTPPYKDATKNKCWVSGYNRASKDFHYC